MNLQALTSKELESVLEGFDAMQHAYDMLVFRGGLDPTADDDIGVGELMDAISEEMTRRAHEDAELVVNQMVGRGELDRCVRPDGQVGYAPPGLLGEGYGEGAL